MAATVGVIVPAAGRGARFGSSENKIWAKIGGRTVLEWTLSAFQSHPGVTCIVVAAAEADLPKIARTSEGFSKVVSVVHGGVTRAESVGNGLAALPDECDLVLVHDAARPCVSQDLISRIIDEAAAFGAAVPGLPASDTLKRVDGEMVVEETIDRQSIWTVQTPQGVDRSLLAKAYQSLGLAVADCTDEAAVLETAGMHVRIVEGEERNIKVTRPSDLGRAETYLRSPAHAADTPPNNVARPEVSHTSFIVHPLSIRTGFGFDVHAFEEGRDLWLGGVRIPHSRGLKGHSDADVVLHAVCDALLGAASMGDIGVLFPDTDVAHKDRRSIEFVQEVVCRLGDARWQIENLDIALLAEEPRIGPYRTQMTEAIAKALGTAPDRVNVKATTAEKMGFVGRGEGIACWAVATISSNNP